MAKKVKIGLIGAGHLGKIHLKLLKEIEGFEVVGFFDTDINVAQKVATDFEVKAYPTMCELMEACDAVDIVAPTISHFYCAEKAIKKFKHIFIEKPVTQNAKEARQLAALVEEAGVKAMVGHVERYNPALLSLDKNKIKPLFIEVHRLAQFNPRGTDVSVVHDLMIHDLDIILSLVKANIHKVSASGVAIVSKSPDIANARIEFDNGCVANVTASRISMKNMRKMRIFQKDAYISIDYLAKKAEQFFISDKPNNIELPEMEIDLGNDTKKYIQYQTTESTDVNAIKLELTQFLEAIQRNKKVPVSVEDGLKAIELTEIILHKIEKQFSEKI